MKTYYHTNLFEGGRTIQGDGRIKENTLIEELFYSKIR